MDANAGQGNSAFGRNQEANETKNRKPPVLPPLPPGPRSPYDFHDARTPPYPPARLNNPAEASPIPQAEFSPRLWNRVRRGPSAAGSDYTYLSISPCKFPCNCCGDEDAEWETDSEGILSPFYDRDIVQERLDHATEYFEFFGNTNCRLPWFNMATPQLLFVDGTFAELAQEIADFLQIGDSVRPLLEQENNEEALQTIVKASSALNSAPEKEFTGAVNLLIHLVLQSTDPKKYLPTLCANLQKPITSSPVHGFTLAVNALSTIFNLLDPTNPVRYNVLLQIVRFLRQHGQFELLKRWLKNLDAWFRDWNTDEEDQRRLYVEISEAANEAGDSEESYHYLIKALGTFGDQEEVASEEAQKLSLNAVRMALLSPTRFDFQDLRALPSVQALADSQPIYAQLLDIFTEQDLEDYNDFRDEHQGWIEKEGLDHETLQRKMRLLTFASLAASTPNREIPYASIAKALQIPTEDIEMWTIDVIRAKLVEGRLSQQQQVFLVHRTTYRVFGEKQWRELGTRVDQWKSTVNHLLTIVHKAKADAEAHREREQHELERKLADANLGGGGGGGGGKGDRRRGPKQPRTDEDD